MDGPTQATFDERLTAPRSWWLITVALAFGGGLIVLPFGVLASLGGLVVVGALAAVTVSSYGSVRVRVVADSLVAGDARIPLSALGEAQPLDAEEAFAWRTHRADARAHMLLRSYVPTALRVEITDPADPTPYLYVSTRHAPELAEALSAARGAAHSG